MRKTIAILSVLATSLISYGASAQPEGAPPAAPPPEGAPPAAAAPEAAPAPAPAPVAAAEDKKIEVGIGFVPVLLGKYKVSGGGVDLSKDLKFGYGFAITAGYAVIPGLTVGIAPQFLFGLKPDMPGVTDSAKEIDIMARVAYSYKLIPGLSVYGEVLPGYSIIMLPDSQKQGGLKNPKGFVVAFGAGAAYDINEMFFANLGIGYQMGFQSTSAGGTNVDVKTSFLRVLVGGGVKF
jgi:hypothetical protein